MDLKILAEDDTLLVVDKPVGFTVEDIAEKLKSQFPELKELGEERRYGIVHRLDKDTSGLLLVAKTKTAFEEIQKQFAARKVEKRYICLVQGNIKQENGSIHTLLGRSPGDRRKQKAYSPSDVGIGRREATTEYKILQRYHGYTLLEVVPKTGRKHQIRAHMVYLQHPIAGDTLYGFKNQPTPEGLTRQFLHASYLKIGDLEFYSPLSEDLQEVLEKLPQKNDNNS